MDKPQTRLTLPLLKARVINRGPNHFTIHFGSEYGSPTTIKIDLRTDMIDLRDGDILTLYTEVLLKQPEGSA